MREEFNDYVRLPVYDLLILDGWAEACNCSIGTFYWLETMNRSMVFVIRQVYQSCSSALKDVKGRISTEMAVAAGLVSNVQSASQVLEDVTFQLVSFKLIK